MHAVVDTNVWVSALLNPRGHAAAVLAAFEQRRFTALVSGPLLSELSDVLSRPKLMERYGLSPPDTARFLALLSEYAEIVASGIPESLVRDRSDLPVVGTAIAGGANAIVTRDADFLGDPAVIAELASQGVEVLSIQRFLERLEDRS